MFTISYAIDLAQSSEQFPVNFNELWQWCGYSSKGNAKKKLVKNFEEDFDFSVIRLENPNADGSFNYIDKISLSLDAAKEFAMLAQTSQGKEVRKYFIEAEKVARKLLNQQPQVVNRQPERVLPKHTAVEYSKAIQTLPDIENLALRELLRDALIDEMSVLQTNKSLPSSPSPVRYTIGKVRARELGYSNKEIGNGSSLGRYLALRLPVAFTDRVGNYNVKHYEVNGELDATIHDYFGQKKILSQVPGFSIS